MKIEIEVENIAEAKGLLEELSKMFWKPIVTYPIQPDNSGSPWEQWPIVTCDTWIKQEIETNPHQTSV